MKDQWEKAEIISKVLSATITPMVVVIIGLLVNSTIQKQQMRLDYVKFAVEVLSKPIGNSEADSLLHDWAFKFISNNREDFLPNSAPKLVPDSAQIQPSNITTIITTIPVR